jgi:hypothetical protein
MPQIATGVAALTWIDSASTLAVGQTNCYLVSAVVSGVESCSAAASATCGTGNPLVSATIPSGTPTSGVNPVTGLKWIAK